MSAYEKACIEDFFTFIKTASRSNDYSGTIVYNISTSTGEIVTKSVRLNNDQPVIVTDGYIDEDITVDTSCNFDTFFGLYSATLDPTNAVLTGKVAVKSWRYRQLSTIMSKFDFSTDAWDLFYGSIGGKPDFSHLYNEFLKQQHGPQNQDELYDEQCLQFQTYMNSLTPSTITNFTQLIGLDPSTLNEMRSRIQNRIAEQLLTTHHPQPESLIQSPPSSTQLPATTTIISDQDLHSPSTNLATNIPTSSSHDSHSSVSPHQQSQFTVNNNHPRIGGNEIEPSPTQEFERQRQQQHPQFSFQQEETNLTRASQYLLNHIYQQAQLQDPLFRLFDYFSQIPQHYHNSIQTQLQTLSSTMDTIIEFLRPLKNDFLQLSPQPQSTQFSTFLSTTLIDPLEPISSSVSSATSPTTPSISKFQVTMDQSSQQFRAKIIHLFKSCLPLRSLNSFEFTDQQFYLHSYIAWEQQHPTYFPSTNNPITIIGEFHYPPEVYLDDHVHDDDHHVDHITLPNQSQQPQQLIGPHNENYDKSYDNNNSPNNNNNNNNVPSPLLLFSMKTASTLKSIPNSVQNYITQHYVPLDLAHPTSNINILKAKFQSQADQLISTIFPPKLTHLSTNSTSSINTSDGQPQNPHYSNNEHKSQVDLVEEEFNQSIKDLVDIFTEYPSLFQTMQSQYTTPESPPPPTTTAPPSSSYITTGPDDCHHIKNQHNNGQNSAEMLHLQQHFINFANGVKNDLTFFQNNLLDEYQLIRDTMRDDSTHNIDQMKVLTNYLQYKLAIFHQINQTNQMNQHDQQNIPFHVPTHHILPPTTSHIRLQQLQTQTTSEPNQQPPLDNKPSISPNHLLYHNIATLYLTAKHLQVYHHTHHYFINQFSNSHLKPHPQTPPQPSSTLSLFSSSSPHNSFQLSHPYDLYMYSPQIHLNEILFNGVQSTPSMKSALYTAWKAMSHIYSNSSQDLSSIADFPIPPFSIDLNQFDQSTTGETTRFESHQSLTLNSSDNPLHHLQYYLQSGYPLDSAIVFVASALVQNKIKLTLEPEAFVFHPQLQEHTIEFYSQEGITKGLNELTTKHDQILQLHEQQQKHDTFMDTWDFPKSQHFSDDVQLPPEQQQQQQPHVSSSKNIHSTTIQSPEYHYYDLYSQSAINEIGFNPIIQVHYATHLYKQLYQTPSNTIITNTSNYDLPLHSSIPIFNSRTIALTRFYQQDQHFFWYHLYPMINRYKTSISMFLIEPFINYSKRKMMHFSNFITQQFHSVKPLVYDDSINIHYSPFLQQSITNSFQLLSPPSSQSTTSDWTHLSPREEETITEITNRAVNTPINAFIQTIYSNIIVQKYHSVRQSNIANVENEYIPSLTPTEFTAPISNTSQLGQQYFLPFPIYSMDSIDNLSDLWLSHATTHYEQMPQLPQPTIPTDTPSTSKYHNNTYFIKHKSNPLSLAQIYFAKIQRLKQNEYYKHRNNYIYFRNSNNNNNNGNNNNNNGNNNNNNNGNNNNNNGNNNNNNNGNNNNNNKHSDDNCDDNNFCETSPTIHSEAIFASSTSPHPLFTNNASFGQSFQLTSTLHLYSSTNPISTTTSPPNPTNLTSAVYMPHSLPLQQFLTVFNHIGTAWQNLFSYMGSISVFSFPTFKPQPITTATATKLKSRPSQSIQLSNSLHFNSPHNSQVPNRILFNSKSISLNNTYFKHKSNPLSLAQVYFAKIQRLKQNEYYKHQDYFSNAELGTHSHIQFSPSLCQFSQRRDASK